jgi:hypothetical protein
MCASSSGSAAALFSESGWGPSQETAEHKVKVQSACALNILHICISPVTNRLQKTLKSQTLFTEPGCAKNSWSSEGSQAFCILSQPLEWCFTRHITATNDALSVAPQIGRKEFGDSGGHALACSSYAVYIAHELTVREQRVGDPSCNVHIVYALPKEIINWLIFITNCYWNVCQKECGFTWGNVLCLHVGSSSSCGLGMAAVQCRLQHGFDSRHYQKKVVGLERGVLSLVERMQQLFTLRPMPRLAGNFRDEGSVFVLFGRRRFGEIGARRCWYVSTNGRIAAVM